MSVILRVDDFPGAKPPEFWKHNLENFKVFDSVLSKFVDSYVLGVIPIHTTAEHLDWLAANERVIVAMHGVEHDERYLNEFREHETEQDIIQKLLSAKAPLRRCNSDNEVTKYIPPHNVVDLKTLRALHRAGFRDILGGPGMDLVFIPFARTLGLNVYYSEHPTWYGRSDELLERDQAHLKILEVGSVRPSLDVYLTLHWTWEWNVGMESLEKFLGAISPVLR